MHPQATIFLVDNDRTVRELISRMLEGQGYALLEAGDGEASVIADQHPGNIDLLVADVVMPRMDGFALAARVVERGPDIKVL